MVSSLEAKLQSKNIVDTFKREKFSIKPVYLRDLALETESIPYD